MPLYSVDSDWSPAIAVATGNIIQNQGANTIYVSAGSADRENAIELKPDAAVTIEAAATVYVSTQRPTISTLAVVTGL